jgi:cytochrome c
MFKLDRKLIISASVATVAALFTAGCMGNTTSTKVTPDDAKPINESASASSALPEIGGGLMYPIKNGKTGPYYVNEKALNTSMFQGRTPTANELKAWDKDIQAGGKGLPEGEGSVEDGEELYEAQCVMCHGDFGSGGGGYPALSKGNAYEGFKTLTNNRWKDPEADGPSRYFGSYWPEASTMWWYIKDGMPHTKSKTLTNDETYALTAYMLAINELKVDGEVVDDEFVLNKENFSKIEMPNKDGFEPNIRGPKALDDVRAYYAVPENFGARKVKEQERCMTNCQDTKNIARVENGGISDFLPPMSVERSLPKVEKKELDVKKTYAANCAMCHDSYLAPGSSEWSSFTEKGMDKVLANAIEGTPNGMPANGGTSLDKEDMKIMVDYIVTGK